jgi:hypothetical protein
MNFPKWLDFILIGGIIGLASAFWGESFDWRVAATCIPAGASSGAALAFLTKRWDGRV